MSTSADKPRVDDPGLLEKIVLKTVDIPSLPQVAQKVLKLIDKDGASIKELEDMIQKDESLSTRVLRVANSPFYGRRRSIDTIKDAILTIGFNTMKSIVVGASLKDLHRKVGPLEEKMWEHSLGVSIAASLIAHAARTARPDEALVAGLVHDVGKTIMNNSLPDKFAEACDLVAKEGISSVEAETRVIGFNHCDVGGFIARKWQFPKTLEAIISYHHSSTFPPFEDVSNEVLCQVINVADAICLRIGISIFPAMPAIEPAFDVVGLSQKRGLEIIEDVKVSFEEQK